MCSHRARWRSGVISGSALARLIVPAVALVVAFVVAPRAMAASSWGDPLVEKRNLIQGVRGRSSSIGFLATGVFPRALRGWSIAGSVTT